MAFYPFDKVTRWLKEYLGEGATTLSERVDIIDTVVDGTASTVGTVNTKLGTPVVSVSADVAAVKVDTAANKVTLEHGTHGLAALKAETDGIDSAVADLDADVAAVKVDTAANKITLEHGTHGLAAIKTKANDIETNTQDLQTKLGNPVATIAGDLAVIDAKIDALKTGDTTFAVRMTPRTDRPVSGNKFIDILITHKNNLGNMEDFDAPPTVLLQNESGSDVSTMLYNASGTQTNVCNSVDTGLYSLRIQYLPSTPLGSYRATVVGIENSVTKKQWEQNELAAAITDAFTGTDRTMLTNIDTNVSDIESKLGVPASGTVVSNLADARSEIAVVDGNVDDIKIVAAALAVDVDNIMGAGFASATHSLPSIRSAIDAIEGLPILFEAEKSDTADTTTPVTIQITENEGVPSVAWKHSQLSVVCSNSTHKFDLLIYKDAALTKLWFDDYNIKANNAVGGIGENLCGLPFINGDAVKVPRIYVRAVPTVGSGTGTYTVKISGEKATHAA